MNNYFKTIATKLVEELIKVGVQCYIYHETNSLNSIYIRFEDSRIGSVRISNHEGRDKLKYKFNLRSDLGLSKLKWKKDEQIWRLYSPIEKYKELTPFILERKKHS